MAQDKYSWFNGNQIYEGTYGKDGHLYSTGEAAQAADKAWDQAHGSTAAMTFGNTSGTTNSLTQQFLKQWGNINDSVLNSLNGAINDIGSGNVTYPGSEQLQSLISQIGQQSADYSKQYGDLESSSINAANEDLANRRTLTNQYMDLANPNYAGVTGQAVTDAQAAADKARISAAQGAMSYGVDPTSGKFGALTQKSYLDEAANEVQAANTARNAEKTRVAGMDTTGLSLINPSNDLNIANNIENNKLAMLNDQANLSEAGTNAAIATTNAKAGIANDIANIGSQYGSAGMTMLGIENGQKGTTNNVAQSTQIGTPVAGMNYLSFATPTNTQPKVTQPAVGTV